MNNQYIPINKGNYTMETPMREKQVQEILAEGWEEAYYKYRRQWEENPKHQYVQEYPLLLDIELSTACNLRCPMCYTITEEFKKRINAQFMDLSLLKKILREISGRVPAVRLSLRGESTLHPHFIECVHLCKQHGIGEVSFLTNGSNLSELFIKQLIASKVDWVTVSIDGMGATYEEIRAPLKFHETLEKIKLFYKLKNELHSKKPVIKVQSIWPAIRGKAEKFYNTFAPYVEWVAFNPLIDYLENDKDICYVEKFSCPQLYQRLIITTDGTALACSNDENGRNPVGNANEQQIYEIWHGQALETLRYLHTKHNGFMQCDLCKHCYLPRQTEDNEREIINGRNITIQNYVGRPQEVGL